MGNRSAVVRKAWVTRRANMVRRRDIKAVAGRLAQYLNFRSIEGGGSYGLKRRGHETGAQRLHRLGIARVKPLRGGLMLNRRLSSLPKRVRNAEEIRKALTRWLSEQDTPKRR